MPMLYLPMLIYAAMLDVVFRDWGHSEHRATIIATEGVLLPPAPAGQRTYHCFRSIGARLGSTHRSHFKNNGCEH
jgi:hypothetical protein